MYQLSKYIGGMLLLFLFVSSCEKFEYNPYQKKDCDNPHDLNRLNIERLKASEAGADDTITIVFSGDCQRFYHNTEELVDIVNGIPGVDFFILAGDITDFGTLNEYEWINDRMSRLKVPYFCAVGNHDLTANGLAIFRDMYGPENFSFKYKGYKFLFHDTNGREYNFNGKVPDLAWLGAQLEDNSVSHFVAVSHVPPYDVDFDQNLEAPYASLFANTPGCRLSLHGHLHEADDSYYYHDGVRYIGSNSVVHEEAILLKLFNGQVIRKTINY